MKIPLIAMARRATNTRRSIALPPIETTRAQRRTLAALYGAVLRVWTEGLRAAILPAYAETTRQMAMVRDSVSDIETAIQGTADRALMAQVTFSAGVSDWAERMQAWHMNRVISQIKYATNVDLGTMIGPRDMQVTVASALARNVALVRSVSDEIRNRIANAVFAGLSNKTPVREVGKQIAAATGMSRRRALRIASDQTVKIAAQLDQERQEQLGITRFKWRHSGKAHPRKEHVARNGKIFEWKSPVGRTDPPGRLPFCGCKAQAVLDLGDTLEEPETTPTPTPAALPAPAPAPEARFKYETFEPFKTVAEGQAWMRANIAGRVEFTKGVKADGLSDLARATLEVNERFDLPKLSFMGDPKADALRWKFPPKATAAYGAQGDAFLFRNAATDRAKQAEQAAYGHGEAYGAKELELAKKAVAESRFVAPEVKELINKMTARYWSVSPDPTRVGYHEMGHRLHLLFKRDEINRILPPMQRGWHYLISKYAGTNAKELVAESFSLYMQGDASQFWRIYPPLLAKFKELDKRAK